MSGFMAEWNQRRAGVLEDLRRRGFHGFHLKRKRFHGHRAVVAFRQQCVVGSMFRRGFQAIIGQGIDFLKHGRNAHGFGVLHAIAYPRRFARRENPRAGIELENPHRPTRGVDPGAAVGLAHGAQAPQGDQEAHRAEYLGKR